MAIDGITLDGQTGLSILSFNEVRQNLAREFKTIFGDNLNTESSAPDGMLIDIFAYAYTEVAQALQGAVAGMNVATAEGLFLDYLGKIMGITRNEGESDEDYRARLQNADLTGLATLDGMRTYLQSRIGSGVSVVDNCEDVEVDGIPPHRVVVYVSELYGDVADDTIAQAIWDCKPAGIKAFGTASGTAKDKAGRLHDVQFIRIAGKPMKVSVKITQYSEEVLPENYVQAIKSALADWAARQYTPGKDVIIQRMYAPIYTVPGIENIELVVTISDVQKSDGVFKVADGESVTVAEDDIDVELVGNG